MPVASTPPTRTSPPAPITHPLPLIVMVVPPAVGPDDGVTDVMVGPPAGAV